MAAYGKDEFILNSGFNDYDFSDFSDFSNDESSENDASVTESEIDEETRQCCVCGVLMMKGMIECDGENCAVQCRTAEPEPILSGKNINNFHYIKLRILAKWQDDLHILGQCRGCYFLCWF